MLSLPARGDSLARRWWIFGVLTYVLLAAVLYGSLALTEGWIDAVRSMVGFAGGKSNPAIFSLVTTGLLLTVLASRYLAKEIAELQLEEEDIEWVHTHGRKGLPLVFEDPAKREKLFRSNVPFERSADIDVRIETLIDDRVRRTYLRTEGSSPASSEELRIIAERRTARWGGLARYISSLLLLLAVLGTFAGVKTALPPLIAAVSAPTASGVQALRAPLDAVANAFGGNALALIGAIAVGLMAQGIAFGRRNLLERLELVSAEFIYGEDVANSADPMQAAMQMFAVSSKDFKDAAGAMMGIETGLHSLGEQFSTSFAELGEKLAELADRTGNELFDRTAANLESLRARVGDLVDIVDANSRVYAGLAPSLQFRSEETKGALAAMSATNTQLSAAMEMLGSASTRIVGLVNNAETVLSQVQIAGTKIAEAGEQTTNNVALLTAAINSVEPKLAAADVALSRIAEASTHGQERLAELWKEFAVRIEGLIGQRDVQERVPATEQLYAMSPPPSGSSPAVTENSRNSPDRTNDVLRALEQINTTLRNLPEPKPLNPLALLASPITNILIAAAAATYWVLHR